MDKRNVGIIATIVTVFLCACPGLFLCIFGGVTAAGIMPYTTEFNDVADSGIIPSGYGFAMLCAALILIAIPVVIGFVTLRKKPAAEEIVDFHEPLPEDDL